MSKRISKERLAALKGLFITGTDTDVGKTYVTALLAQYLLDKHQACRVIKPIASGGYEDATYLKSVLALQDDLKNITPICMTDPVAPRTATLIRQERIDWSLLQDYFDELARQESYVLCEGVGGITVPLEKGYWVSDWIAELGLPALVVARAGLGTLNHTLLTLEHARNKGLRVQGIVLNHVQDASSDPAYPHNAQIIEEESGIPLVLEVKQGGEMLWHSYDFF